MLTPLWATLLILATRLAPCYPCEAMTRAAASRLARHLRRLGYRVAVLRHRAPCRGRWFYSVECL